MARQPQEDLFEGTKMTFGEHIEELRVALFQGLIGLAIGVALGFYIANDVVKWIQTPLKAALDEYYLGKAVDDLTAQYQGKIPFEMITIVREERLAPATMKVNPESLIEALNNTETGEFTGLEFQPHRFASSDVIIEQLGAFLSAWSAAGRNEPESPAGVLWKRLSNEQQQTLTELAKKEQPAADDARTVAGVLNELVNQPDMHEAPELQTVESGDKYMDNALAELRMQTESGELSDANARRLNRLLLAAVFPDYLARPRVRLVDLPFWKPVDIKVQALGASEAFMIWMKAAFIAGLVISAPWVFWKIWQFVAAGLYPHERHYVFIYLPFSLILFFAGAAMAFFFVFQPVLSFLFSFNKSMNIDPDPRISEWLSFVLFLPLGFGISFQLPLVMLFLQRIGILSVELYVSKWRIAILAIFVIAMVLTPADPISMLMMALPLSVLYFGGIALCMWMPRGRNPFSELQTYEP